MGGRCGWEWGIRFLLAPYQLHPEYIFPPKLRIRPVLDERPHCKRDIKVSKQFPFTIVAVALIAAELRGIYRLVQIFYEPYNNSLLWVTFVPLSAAHKHQRFNDEKCLSPLLILRSPFALLQISNSPGLIAGPESTRAPSLSPGFLMFSSAVCRSTRIGFIAHNQQLSLISDSVYVLRFVCPAVLLLLLLLLLGLLLGD